MFTVTFEYCETNHKWDVFVSGAKDPLEAVQAFVAVLQTASLATALVCCNRADLQPDNRYKISVGIMAHQKN